MRQTCFAIIEGWRGAEGGCLEGVEGPEVAGGGRGGRDGDGLIPENLEDFFDGRWLCVSELGHRDFLQRGKVRGVLNDPL